MTGKSRVHEELRDMAVLALFAALMVISDQMMNALPNVHLIAMFVILLTVCYRSKALLSIYLFVIIDGLIEGFFFSTWVMYSYIWFILWGAAMLLPKNMPVKVCVAVYPLLGALHGLLFGVLSSPASYFLFFPKSAWNFASYGTYILKGLSFDVLHMVGNFFSCMLVVPLLTVLRRLKKKKV